MFQLFRTEIMKYKRSSLPWLLGLAVFPSIVTRVMMAYNPSMGGWEGLVGHSLLYLNELSLVVIAACTGFVVAGEFQYHTIGTLLAYPLPRWRLLGYKFIFLFGVVAFIYLVSFLATLGVGRLYLGMNIPSELGEKYIRLSLEMIMANYALVPVTVLLCLRYKNLAAAALTGLGYLVFCLCFNGTTLNDFIPPCLPSALVVMAFQPSLFPSFDIQTAVITSAIIGAGTLIMDFGYFQKANF